MTGARRARAGAHVAVPVCQEYRKRTFEGPRRWPASLARFFQMRSACAARSFLDGRVYLPAPRILTNKCANSRFSNLPSHALLYKSPLLFLLFIPQHAPLPAPLVTGLCRARLRPQVPRYRCPRPVRVRCMESLAMHTRSPGLQPCTRWPAAT